MAVIGASGVFGRLTAQSLREAGATVVAVAREPERLESALAAGPHAQADIRSLASLREALAPFGPLDGIINCAGVVAFGTFAQLQPSTNQTLFDTNAVGTVNLLTVAGELVAEGGFVASFTGVAADMTITGMGAYCASKAAAKTAMAVGVRELRVKKITVLDIRAPHTETGLVARAIEGEAPKMPAGLEPQVVVDRVLAALEAGDRDLPADAFATA